MKDIRVKVTTNDGCRTIWYEKSKLKNPTESICKRVNEQLQGLNIKRVEVSLSPADDDFMAQCELANAYADSLV